MGESRRGTDRLGRTRVRVEGLPVQCGCSSRMLLFLTGCPWSLLWASQPAALGRASPQGGGGCSPQGRVGFPPGHVVR